MKRIALPVGLALSTLVCGCATTEDIAADEARDEFTLIYEDFAGVYGEKGDWPGLPDPCDVLAPILGHGDAGLHSGFYAGVAGEGVLGPGVGVSGKDVVFDLYNQQMGASMYSGLGVSLSPELAVAGQAYAGVAFGFGESVADWYSWFVTASGSVGAQIPFFEIFVAPHVFTSGIDGDKSGFITPDEVLLPPNGVFGIGMGIGARAELDIPFPIDIGVTVTEGKWHAHRSAIRGYYDDFVAIGVDVQLLDSDRGTECDPEWPAVDRDANCVIQFGANDEGPIRRSFDLVTGLCAVAGGCALPLSWPMSAQAIATAAVRSSELDLESFCR